MWTGWSFPIPTRVRYLTQTTLSLDETRDIVNRLKQRFPLIQGPPAQDICYATENRQMAVKAISEAIDLLLVVGSENSSNSKRLVEVGDNFGVRSYLVNDRGDVDTGWLDGVKNVGVTAGASAPEHLVQELIEFLREHGFHQTGGDRTGGRRRALLAARRVDGTASDERAHPSREHARKPPPSEAMRRAAAHLAGLQAARRPLVRRTDRRHHAGIRLHPLPALAVPAPGRPVGAADPAADR